MFVVKHPNMGHTVVPYYIVCTCGCEFVASDAEFREVHLIGPNRISRFDHKPSVKCSYCGRLISKDDGCVGKISSDDAAKYYLNSIARARM